MSEQNGYTSKPVPVFSRFAQPGSPVSHLHSSYPSIKTQGLWMNAGQNPRSFSWRAPADAPGVVTTTTGSYVDMTFDPSGSKFNFRIPWTVQPSCTKIGMRIIYARPNPLNSVTIKATTETLISAVASTPQVFGGAVTLASSPPRGMWSRESEQYVTGSGMMEIEPALPADRRIAVKFGVQFGSGDADEWRPLSTTTRKCLLYSLVMFDVLDAPPAESAP